MLRGVHPSIDAALGLKAKHNINPKEIKEIRFDTGAANYKLLCTPFDAKVKPRNPVDAQFSIPWGIATTLVKGRITMGDYTPEAIKSKQVLELTGKLKAEVDHALDSPRGIEPARITVTMATVNFTQSKYSLLSVHRAGPCHLMIASRSLKTSFPLTEAG